MSKQYDLNISDISYTLKDFADAYPELLRKAEQLSAKYDPTQSNESDPGVVLIKEIALAIDKISYNSDKNILENFPLSATQLKSARQLYNILGYNPQWYKSSEVLVALAWQNTDKYEESDVKDNFVTIPKFTVLQDENQEVFYTLVEEAAIDLMGDKLVSVKAIEGLPRQLQINGSNVITINMLDSDNRVYIGAYNVAQNGVFIYGKDLVNDIWKQVDNLNTQTLGEKIYQFGIDLITGNCYIEFPEDIVELIGDGVRVTYITSKGALGNISVGVLNSLKNGSINCLVTKDIKDSDTILVDSTDLYISNVGTTSFGYDPENLDDMYRSWKRIAGTFDTLVTLRDYTNALIRTEECSNGFVTDRTNDPLGSYRIVSESSELTTKQLMQDESIKLNAFGLKIYALQNCPANIDNYGEYDKSFVIYPDLDPNDLGSNLNNLVDLIEDYKCIQHDYNVILPDKIAYFRNKYPINCNIITNIEMTSNQIQNLKQVICKALYKELNSKKIEFGEKIDYSTVYDIITNCDNRIRNASVDIFNYDTYGVYFDSNTNSWKEVCVSDECLAYTYGYYVGGKFYLDDTNRKLIKALINKFYLDIPTQNVYVFTGLSYELYSNRRVDFRVDILTKNILAGITPLYTKNNTSFDYSFGYKADDLVDNVVSIIADAYLDLVFNATTNPDTVKITLNDNDLVQFYKPTSATTAEYGSYVNYELVMPTPIPAGGGLIANRDYELKAGEFLTVFFKESDADERYRCVRYCEGTTICPSFNIGTATNTVSTLGLPFGTTGGPYTGYYNPSSTATYDLCTSDLSIKIKELAVEKFTKAVNYCYVVTNNTIDIDDLKYYTLSLTPDLDYILSTGEYFIYTDSTKTSLNVLDAGTKIHCSRDIIITAPVILNQDINKQGVKALEDAWVEFDDAVGLEVMQLEFYNCSEGDEMEFVLNAPVTTGSVTYHIDRNGVTSSSSTGSIFGTTINPAAGITTNPSTATINNRVLQFVTNNWGLPATNTTGKLIFVSEDLGNTGIPNPETIVDPADANITHITKARWDELKAAGTEPFASYDYPYNWSVRNSGSAAEKIITNEDFLQMFDNLVYMPSWTATVGTWNAGLTLSVDYTYTVDGLPTELDPFKSIIIKDSSGTELLTIRDGEGYGARALLSLQCGPDKPQKLSPNQTIRYFADDNRTIPLGVVTGSVDGTYIYCSLNIEMDGASNSLNVSIKDNYGNVDVPSFYSLEKAELVQPTDGSYEVKLNGGDILVKCNNVPITSGTKKIVNNLRLPVGKYILKVVNQSTNITDHLTISYGENDLPTSLTQLQSISPVTTNFANSGIYYIELNIEHDTGNTCLWFDCESNGAGQFIISMLSQVDINPCVEDVGYNTVLDRIKVLDTTQIYNYLYTPVEEDRIDNPLQGNSFLKQSHVFNKYTICEAYTPQVVFTE